MRIAIAFEVNPDNARAIQWALDRLFTHNLALLLSPQGRRIPPLHRSGVRYAREPWTGVMEEFAAIPIVLARQWGDCDDLSAWRAAELTAQGIPARAVVIEAPGSKQGARRWHCVTARCDGFIEDPSFDLGMKGSS